MNKILSLDSNKGYMVVQPGINYGKLQQTLHTHGVFLPPFPASLEYSTIGGAIANNAAGEKSIKYGVTRDYVNQLRVVLANGEVINTGRLNKRELNRKMGLATFEGEIYRTIDAILSENRVLLEQNKLLTNKNVAGYDLWSVGAKDGSMDLTPLFVGSQGTLGIVTEARLESEIYNPKTTLLAAMYDSIEDATQAVLKLKSLEPSAIEFVDDHLLNFIETHNPNQLKSIVMKPFPKIILLVEFDDPLKRTQNRRSKKAKKILETKAREVRVAKDENLQEDFWKIRHSAAAILWQNVGNKKALPIVEDGIVPPEKLAEFLHKSYDLFKQFNLDIAVWGHAGNANLHMQPFLDLNQIGDRQTVFKLMDAYYKMVVEMGGSTSAEHNDGRLRAPYLKPLYGNEIYELFKKVKQLFDPYNTMNPGVKIDVTIQDLQPLMRREYSISHLYDHMPRT
jgi:FAD/FMN-containing dehydrogenase